MIAKHGSKSGRPTEKVLRKMRLDTVRNLAKGMSATAALIKAGYSPISADQHGYKIIQHPEIQSRLTRAVENVLAQESLEYEEIVRPYVKALKATVVVKNSQTLEAAETAIPDHPVRMEAATHIARLYQPKTVEPEAEQRASGPPVVYQINFVDGATPPPVVVANSRPVPVSPVPEVTFVRPPRNPR